MKRMNVKREIPSSLYWILAVVGGVFLYLFIYVVPSARTGTCTAFVDATRRTWTIEGTKSRVNVITVELVQSKKTENASEQALTMAGRQLQLVQSSRAVHVTFDNPDDEVIVTIRILPAALTAKDYEYLTANHLAVIGTIDWKTCGVSEAMAAVQNDGTDSTCRLQ